MRQQTASRAEGQQTSINGLSSRVVRLVMFIFGSFLLDAVLTLWHLEQGGCEANPLMALTLAASPTLFMSVKAAASGIGVCVLAAHAQRPLALRGLYGAIKKLGQMPDTEGTMGYPMYSTLTGG